MENLSEVQDYEFEKASNSYLMSLLAIVVGLPIPIINLLATIIFFLMNRRESYFVRWHCTQALISQFATFILNSFSFWWTIDIIFTDTEITNQYLSYLICVIIFNIIEFIGTIQAAIKIRKGEHATFWIFGQITDLLCKQKK